MPLNVVWYMVLLFEGIHTHSIINASTNPFDGGPLSYCQKPPIQPGSICSDVVLYAVPTSLAKLTKIIETLIVDNLEEQKNQQCRDLYRRTLCLERFPRCQWDGVSNSFQVILNEDVYTAVLSQNCGEYAKRISGIEKTFRVDGSCLPTSELTESFLFKKCEVNSKGLVTPWMLEYLKAVDITTTYGADLIYNYPICGKKILFVLCNFIGRCTSEGHVQFINSYDSCRKATSCYSDELRPTAEHYAHCDQWPHVAKSLLRYPTHEVAGKVGGIGISQINSAAGDFSAVATVLFGMVMSHYAI